MPPPPKSNRLVVRLWPALAAAAIFSVGILVGLVAGSHREPEAPLGAAPAPPIDLPGDSGAVRASLRRVRFRVFHDVALDIAFLRGALTPTRAGRPVSFDDPTSFNIAIDTARIALDTADLSGLLNQFVFRYQGAALRDLHAETDSGRLRLRGKIHKLISLPFTIVASVQVTPEGIIRLHPDQVKVLGIGVKGLLGALGVELDDLIRNNRLHGVKVVENDLELDPTELLPPPRIRGRLRKLLIEPGAVVQIFGHRAGGTPFTPSPPLGAAAIAFRGGELRFGKLTMADADMRILRPDSAGQFDFYLDHYLAQLTAGYHTTTPTNGLDVVMPDYAEAEKGTKLRAPH